MFQILFLIGFVIMLNLHSLSCKKISVTNLLDEIEKDCKSDYTSSCVKSRATEWINFAQNLDEVIISDSVSVVKTGEYAFGKNHDPKSTSVAAKVLDSIDDYISSHSLKVKFPEDHGFEQQKAHAQSHERELIIPLHSNAILQGRGFVRKALIPFLMGLKFQTSVLVPLALAMIALKTWKAMTFGLLSLVLSGAIVVFKLLKQNIINYEVIQPPIVEHSYHQHSEVHSDSLPYNDYYRANEFDTDLQHHVDHRLPGPFETETGQLAPNQPAFK